MLGPYAIYKRSDINAERMKIEGIREFESGNFRSDTGIKAEITLHKDLIATIKTLGE